MMLSLISLLGILALILTEAWGKDVRWWAFFPGIASTMMMVLLGACIRKAKGYTNLASVSVGIGLYIGFSTPVSILIFALYPLTAPLVDSQLAAMDAVLGFHWSGFVNALASLPAMPEFLNLLYLSSFQQIAFIIVFLGATGRETAQQRFILVGMLALCAAIPFFYFFPSVGPPPFDPISAELQARFGVATIPAYGTYLLELIRVGPPYIAPEVMVGVIGFPSFHIITALMVFWYTRKTVLAVPAGIIGIVTIPATLAVGGHHLMDLLGGLAVFVACVWLASKLIPDQPRAVN